MTKTSNGKIRRANLVANKVEFTANNIFSRKGSENWYTVFSYGSHWPLFHWDGKQWYANITRYGVTTSKHFGQAHPGVDCVPLSVAEMKAKI